MRASTVTRAVLGAVVALCLLSGSVPGMGRGVRGTTVTSVNRGSVNANISRNNANVNRNIDANRDLNVDRDRNIDVNRNVNVNRDINVGVDPGYGRVEHPVAAAAVVTAAAVATAVALGTVVYTLPYSCEVVYVNGICYNNCDGTWYQPELHGDTVEYTVVPPPS